MHMEAEVIRSFLPDLVTAISDCVQLVSDQYLAKGLISDSVYKRVLESGGTSEDKARTLILAVKKSTETDSRCFEILLNILDQQLPHTIKEKLLSEIRKELNEKLVTSQNVQSEDLPRESVLLQNSLLGKFEDSIRQHERACAERSVLEEKLKAKLQEYECLKSQTQEASSTQSSMADAQSRITCEREIESLKEKVEMLELIIEEQGMNVKRGRNTVVFKTEKMLETVAQQNQTATWEKAQKEIRIKEREFALTIQEKDLRMKELELESKKHKESFLNQSHNVGPLDILREGTVGLLLKPLQRSGHKKLLDRYWRNLGSQLGFTTKELDEIDKDRSKDKLFAMLNEWAYWYPGDRRGSTNFATYSGLQRAFVKIGLGDILFHMLSYKHL